MINLVIIKLRIFVFKRYYEENIWIVILKKIFVVFINKV